MKTREEIKRELDDRLSAAYAEYTRERDAIYAEYNAAKFELDSPPLRLLSAAKAHRDRHQQYTFACSSLCVPCAELRDAIAYMEQWRSQ